jgi:hypothetical protein
MGWLRVAVAVFAMLHGGAHLMWFLGAWIPRTHAVGPEPWLFSPGVTITGAVGRLSGLLALAAATGFVAAGIGVLTAAAWWSAVMLAAAGLSVVVVVPWWCRGCRRPSRRRSTRRWPTWAWCWSPPCRPCGSSHTFPDPS